MTIRRDKAEFLDNVLKLFTDVRLIRKKDLEVKYRHDYYLFFQTEKHIKILEADGMIRSDVFDEYYLEPQGRKVLNDIENLGYLAKHKIDEIKNEAELKKMEEKEGKFYPFLELILGIFHFK